MPHRHSHLLPSPRALSDRNFQDPRRSHRHATSCMKPVSYRRRLQKFYPHFELHQVGNSIIQLPKIVNRYYQLGRMSVVTITGTTLAFWSSLRRTVHLATLSRPSSHHVQQLRRMHWWQSSIFVLYRATCKSPMSPVWCVARCHEAIINLAPPQSNKARCGCAGAFAEHLHTRSQRVYSASGYGSN